MAAGENHPWCARHKTNHIFGCACTLGEEPIEDSGYGLKAPEHTHQHTIVVESETYEATQWVTSTRVTVLRCSCGDEVRRG